MSETQFFKKDIPPQYEEINDFLLTTIYSSLTIDIEKDYKDNVIDPFVDYVAYIKEILSHDAYFTPEQQRKRRSNFIMGINAKKGRLQQDLRRKYRMIYLNYILSNIVKPKEDLTSLSLQALEFLLFQQKTNEKKYSNDLKRFYTNNKTNRVGKKLKHLIEQQFIEMLEKYPSIRQISAYLIKELNEDIATEKAKLDLIAETLIDF